MLSLRSVSAGYGPVEVLHGVDLVVPDGAVVALLGANGAGKTTLLRVASGLLQPDSGNITVDGERLTGRPTHAFAEAGICHVPEGRGIFKSLTVRENIRFYSSPAEEERTFREVVDVFPVLGKRLNQIAGTLSGGEQQMLALSRAYTTGARTVLLDEVSLGLAPKIVGEIFDFIAELSHRGIAILLVEQYVQKALALAEYVYILNRGRLAFAGEPGELDMDAVFASYVGA